MRSILEDVIGCIIEDFDSTCDNPYAKLVSAHDGYIEFDDSQPGDKPPPSTPKRQRQTSGISPNQQREKRSKDNSPVKAELEKKEAEEIVNLTLPIFSSESSETLKDNRVELDDKLDDLSDEINDIEESIEDLQCKEEIVQLRVKQANAVEKRRELTEYVNEQKRHVIASNNELLERAFTLLRDNKKYIEHIKTLRKAEIELKELQKSTNSRNRFNRNTSDKSFVGDNKKIDVLYKTIAHYILTKKKKEEKRKK